MTQPPYVPPRDDNSSAADYTWPPAQETPVAEEKDSELFASQFPESGTTGTSYTEGTYSQESYVEPVSSYAVSGDYTTGEPSTTDVAKDQAGEVKDTAVQQGQQVAGVAKEQAGAVKDTAVEQGQHVAGVAKEQAGAVKDTAVEQGQHVAEVAKEQVSNVASEATGHVKDLLAEGLSEVRSQAGSQQKRLATGVHSLAEELGSMASKSEKSGPLTDFAHQASAKAGEFGHWLESAEPHEVLDSLRTFARRRPAAFLAASAVAGVVVGRLSRSLAANAKSESDAKAVTSSYSSTPQYAVESAPRENISLQEVPTSGSGYGYTTDAPDYVADDATLGYGTTDRDGFAR